MSDLLRLSPNKDNIVPLDGERIRDEAKPLIDGYLAAFRSDPIFQEKVVEMYLDLQKTEFHMPLERRSVWVPKNGIYYTVNNNQNRSSDYLEMSFSTKEGYDGKLADLRILYDEYRPNVSEISIEGVDSRFVQYRGKNTEAAVFWAGQILEFVKSA
ncbi:MAG TPA: hypothetical protein VMR81_04525 [Patescibacteria group bacterium]|nr:hypothetical protein [Patescibacteria group bacterium]